MGSISLYSVELTSEQSGNGNINNNTINNKEKKLNIDFSRNILPDFTPLIKWKLQQIRDIYTPYRKRKGSPLLIRSQFQRFIQLSRITSNFLFDKLKKNNVVNVFEILTILALTAFGKTNHKIQCNILQFIILRFKQLVLFIMFDLSSSKMINYKQLILLLISLIKGYALITGQQKQIGEYKELQKYSQLLLMRADINNQQTLQLSQILAWFQSQAQGMNLFNRFQPKQLGKQNYHIFNKFCPYSSYQIQIIFKRLHKLYYKEEFIEQDFKNINPYIRNKSIISNTSQFIINISFLDRRKSNINQNLDLSQSILIRTKNNLDQIQKSQKDHQGNQKKNTQLIINNQSIKRNSSLNSKISKQNLISFVKNQNQKIIKRQNSSKIKLPMLNKNKLIQNSILKQSDLNSYHSTFPINSSRFTQDKSNLIKAHTNRKNCKNIIITQGRSITKNQIFELRDYFDKISNGKQKIKIQDFQQSFNQDKYIHMKSIAVSLFNFLDRNQIGQVTFIELISRIYPNLNKKNLQLILKWNEEYNQNFRLDSKIMANKQLSQNKKRFLPKSCIKRLKQFYVLFDKDSKGFVQFQDLKRVLGQVSTIKQLKETFQQCDKDQDGKLSFVQFSKIVLPLGINIQGL